MGQNNNMTNFKITPQYQSDIIDAIRIINRSTKYVSIWYLNVDEGAISKELHDGSIPAPTSIQVGELGEAQSGAAAPYALALFASNISRTAFYFKDATFYELTLISLAFALEYSGDFLNENKDASNVIEEDPFKTE